MLLDLLAPFSDDLASSTALEDEIDDDADDYQRGLGGRDLDDGDGGGDVLAPSTSVSEMLELARYYASHASAAASSSSPSPLSALRARSAPSRPRLGSESSPTRHRHHNTDYDYGNSSDAASLATGDLLTPLNFPDQLPIRLSSLLFYHHYYSYHGILVTIIPTMMHIQTVVALFSHNGKATKRVHHVYP